MTLEQRCSQAYKGEVIMSKLSVLIGTGLASVALVVALTTPALAWHPVGKISKQVQNETQKSQLAEANNPGEAVEVKPGDTVKYVVTVKNSGQKHSQGHNDMHFTKVTDKLPAGVELVSGDTNADLGRINAGDSKKYEFTAKVTSQKDGDVICNKAEFTGDSEVKDAPQKGSDTACIVVKVPKEQPKPVEKMIEVCYKDKGPKMYKIKEPEFDAKTMSKNVEDCKKPEEPKPEPKPPVTPEEPKAEEPKAPVKLPETGAASVAAQILGLGATAGAGIAYWRSRQ